MTAREQLQHCHELATTNIEFLAQGKELISTLSDEDYVRSHPDYLGGGIGTHMRHVIDHYVCFLDGFTRGIIDYDQRQRNREVERSREVALAAIDNSVARLGSVSDADGGRRLGVLMDCGAGTEAVRVASDSTVSRELQFLVSHTVHHYALFAVMLTLSGQRPPAGFGVAPSTRRYLEGK